VAIRQAVFLPGSVLLVFAGIAGTHILIASVALSTFTSFSTATIVVWNLDL